MTELSPDAQTVLDVVLPVYDDEHLYVATAEKHAGMIAAAALRAAADQVVPVPIKSQTPEEYWALLGVKNRLLVIADELMADTYIISAEDNDNGDVTELVKDVADKIDGVTVKFKEGGHIRITGDAKIVISEGRISL